VLRFPWARTLSVLSYLIKFIYLHVYLDPILEDAVWMPSEWNVHKIARFLKDSEKRVEVIRNSRTAANGKVETKATKSAPAVNEQNSHHDAVPLHTPVGAASLRR
jgi:hypothetical protein